MKRSSNSEKFQSPSGVKFRRGAGLTLAMMICAVFGKQAHAAAPKFTALYPAGGQKGTEVAVTVTGTVDPWPVKVHTDAAALTITTEKDKGKLKIQVAADAVPGLYWFRLYNDEGATVPIPFVVGSVPEVLEKEPNNEASDATPVPALPAVVNGVLSRGGEVDTFSLNLKKGQTLVASIVSRNLLGSPMDGVLQVVSENGFVLAQNDDYHGLDPQIVFPIPSDGVYRIRTFAFPATPDSSINFAGGNQYVYRLTVTDQGFVDYVSPLAITRHQPATVNLLGWNLPANAQLSLPAPEAGDKGVVSAPEAANDVAVDYVDYPSLVEDALEGKKIVPPVAVTGRLATPAESDVYEIDAKKGQKFTISVEARSKLLPLDPVVVVTDSQGKVVRELDDARRDERDVEVEVTAPADGPLRLEVKDLHRRGGERFVYLMKVVPTAGDYSLSLAAEQFTLTPGTPLEVPVTVNRKYGFGEEIDVEVQGLPEGVKFEIVEEGEKSSNEDQGRGGRRRGRRGGGGSGQTVKLKLTAEKGPASGVIRIVGTSQGDSKLTRFATATIPNNTLTTDSPWLTVLAPKEEKKEEKKEGEEKK